MTHRISKLSTLLLALSVACTGGTSASDQNTLGGGNAGPTGPTGPDQVLPAKAQPQVPTLRLWRPEGNPIAPVRYRAALQVDPEAPTFTGRIAIELEIAQAVDQIWLNATDLKVTSAAITANGETWPVTPFDVKGEDGEPVEDFVGFPTGKSLAIGTAVLEVEYEGVLYDKDSSGLFRQKDDDGRWYVYSHMEPLSARRVFPCFDEPMFKVPWQIALTVKDGHMALANTPETMSKPAAAGWKTVSFADSKPLPSYLVALAVGPFDAVDIGPIGRNKVPARIIVPKGRGGEAGYAVATTPILLQLLEDYFDSPYPYAKLDSIAVLKFGGAMENPGLITYSQGLLLAKDGEDTLDFKRRYAGVGAHELAHQWFGDLVTLAWWDDIWLNESFATWMASKVVRKWKPEWDGDVYAVRQADRSMRSDSLATARRIRQPIRSKHDIVGAFDSITYGKGGAVLTMFEQWIGEDKFREGVQSYLEKHAWSTATAADFLAAISAVSRPEVAAGFDSFLEHPGVPLVSVSLACENGAKPALEVSQDRFLPAGSKGESNHEWTFPVCVKYGDGRAVRSQCELVSEKTARIELAEARKCPSWVAANAGASGYYRVAYAEGMLGALFGKAARQLSTPERVSTINDVEALVDTGKVSIGEALALVPRLAKEKDHHLVGQAVGIANGMPRELIPEALRANHTRFIRKMFGARARKLGWKRGPRDSDETHDLRGSLVGLVANTGEDKALIAQAVKLAEKWIETRDGIDHDLLGSVLITAGRYGDAALHGKFLAAAKAETKSDDRRRLMLGAAATVDPELMATNLEFFLSSELDFRDLGVLVQFPLGREETRDAAYEWFKANYDAVLAKLPRQYQAFIIYTASGFCDDAHLQDAKAFFGPKAPTMLGGPKAFAQTIERIELCIAFRAAQQANIAKFLEKY